MLKDRLWMKILAAAAALILLALLFYQVPAVHDRLAWRVDNAITRIKYTLNPPDQAVFIPGEAGPDRTPTLIPPASPTPDQPTPEAAPESTERPTSPTPAETGTPLPEFVKLDGVTYVHQHERWNYCGPANLTMALNYWGWPGDRDDVARAVKPGVNNPDLSFIQRGRTDKNVMPYEMIDFIVEETQFHVVARYGGDLEVVKRLIAGGFPVIVEKGYYEEDYTGTVAWMGHYLFTTGYDEASQEFIVQDAYLEPGKNMRVDYQTYLEGWRSFNYLFLVVYPPDQQDQVYELLGPWGDPEWSYTQALETAEEEIQTLSEINLFFAWFNKGTSLVKLQRYLEAAEAYDRAFEVYSRLENDDTQRPYRIMWYQTWPYMAYYYSGRYQDTLDLANHTLLETISEPTLEESLYWRALAKEALGDVPGAITDLNRALTLNQFFDLAAFHLNRIQNQ